MAARGRVHGSFHFLLRVDCFPDERRLRDPALLPRGVSRHHRARDVFGHRPVALRFSRLDRDGAVPCLAALVFRRFPGLLRRSEDLDPPLPVQCWCFALRYDPADVAGLLWPFFDAHSNSMRFAAADHSFRALTPTSPGGTRSVAAARGQNRGRHHLAQRHRRQPEHRRHRQPRCPDPGLLPPAAPPRPANTRPVRVTVSSSVISRFQVTPRGWVTQVMVFPSIEPVSIFSTGGFPISVTVPLILPEAFVVCRFAGA